jgi:hypothetical protein
VSDDGLKATWKRQLVAANVGLSETIGLIVCAILDAGAFAITGMVSPNPAAAAIDTGTQVFLTLCLAGMAASHACAQMTPAIIKTISNCESIAKRLGELRQKPDDSKPPQPPPGADTGGVNK